VISEAAAVAVNPLPLAWKTPRPVMMNRSIEQPSLTAEEFLEACASRAAGADGAQQELPPKDSTALKPSDAGDPYPIYEPHMFGL
jgi:hypothetical protein